ncbi:PilW family protein [Variovorax arabinosiphilus]|uniref:PilW family protein n=1 Tax=Variovorax arabinosiphilus TaxID=3053498 RepID=UPI002575135C|nr:MULTISPECIES: PilW family protein [unclassified Variovorax]MDM0118761.1 PilW family protein [Variovorax sp. J2L1-78]MDM0129186.1 PilW family protein [Variovorax sp. J2L1-63]MDM0233027.1 PilW family protein [Variovorax sp. J2R1-6]
MTSRRRASEGRRGTQCGVTLVELMVAMTIGLLVILAASIAFLAGKKLFNADADVQATQDSLRFARYVVQSVVRQAGYADYAPDRLSDGVAVIASNAVLLGNGAGTDELNVVGATNATVKSNDGSIGAHDTDDKAQNDSLLVRFFGRSKADADVADDTIIDCLGHPQKGPSATPTAADRVWSFFYVSVGSDDVPALYCKFRTKAGGFHSEQLARGVEKFKVVYGYDGDGDSVPETWLDAKAIDARAKAAGTQVSVEWRKVVAVRVGIVVRSDRANGDLKKIEGQSYTLYPLGPAFKDVAFEPPDDGRFRSVATFTLMLRNVVKDPA